MTTQLETKSILSNPIVLKRGVSYRRVSTDEQAAAGFSLPTQLAEIQAYASKNGIEIVGDFQDDFTGSSLDRPGLKEARKWLKMGKADCIICLDSDRLTREPSHYMLLRDELKDQGIELHYAKRGRVDLSDFGQMLVEDFYGRFNHQWKQKLIEATTRGRRGMAASGHVIVHGRAPYGYRFEKVNGKGTLTIYEPEATIVRLIYRLYVYEDKGYWAIVNQLTAANVSTRADSDTSLTKKRGKGEWSTATIQHILRGEVYRGKWYYSKRSAEPILIEVPAIIHDDLWKAAQIKRSSNKGGRLAATNEYLLSGRGKCDCCQSPIVAQSVKWKSKNASGVTLFYRCASAYVGGGRVGIKCNTGTYNAKKVEGAVWEWVKGLIIDHERLSESLRRYQERRGSEIGPLREELERINKLIAKKQARLERARNLYLEGDEDKASYLFEKRNLEADIAGLESDRQEVQEKLEVFELSPERIATIHELAALVREGLEILDQEPNFTIKRKIINLLDVRVRLTIENGEKIAWASCVLNPNALLTLRADCTNSKTPKSSD